MNRDATAEGDSQGAEGARHEARPILWRLALPLASGLNALLFSLAYVLFVPRFIWNDDPMMMLLAAGVGRTVEPTMELVTTHYFIGWALSRLYSLALDIPWYGLYLVAGLFTAHTTFLFLCLRARPTALSIVLYLLFFASSGVLLLLQLQFTITATWLSTCGLLCMGPTSCGDMMRARFGGVARNALATALVVGGGLMREEGMYLAVAVAWPLLAGRRDRKSTRLNSSH